MGIINFLVEVELFGQGSDLAPNRPGIISTCVWQTSIVYTIKGTTCR
jgi:hypothetical protein